MWSTQYRRMVISTITCFLEEEELVVWPNICFILVIFGIVGNNLSCYHMEVLYKCLLDRLTI